MLQGDTTWPKLFLDLLDLTTPKNDPSVLLLVDEPLGTLKTLELFQWRYLTVWINACGKWYKEDEDEQYES